MKTIETRVGDVTQHTIENNYLKVDILSYGAALFHVYVKTANGLKEVSVQPNDIDEFLTSDFYYGKTVGRTAGRIFAPSYEIGDDMYLLSEDVILHGGEHGFSYKHFDIIEATDHKMILSATSYEDEGPYDGVLTLVVTYELVEKQLLIRHDATTTKETLCNITNHVYLNLDQQKTIDQQKVMISSDRYLNIDDQNRVLNVNDVSHTPFDFRTMTPFKEHLNQMVDTSFHGFDHTMIFNHDHSMIVSSEDIKMTLKTSYPAVVLYTHNKPAPHALVGQKQLDNRHIAFTIECQFEPGGVQVEGLHDAILRPNETYDHYIALTFEVLS